MAQTPVDISGVLPGSISEDEQVQDMATAVAAATMDPALPKVLRRHIDELSAPPHAVLDALARHFDADVWDEDWDKGRKRENLRTILRWHELKGTPEGLRLTFERDGVPESRIFEEWPRLQQWLYYQNQRRFDETALDTEALDFEPNSFYRDASLSMWDYWAALRPGWGPGTDFQRAADLTERVAASRVALKVPSVAPAVDITTGAGGRHSAGSGFSVDSPDGELILGEGVPPGRWAISAWADVNAASMDANGVLLAAHRNRAGHAAIRRSGSTTEFELHVQTGGTDHYISPSFTLSGWHYLTLRRDESKIAALDGDRLLASATVPKFSGAWQPAIGSRPGSSNHGPDRHANARFSDVMLWRRTPAEEAERPQSSAFSSWVHVTTGSMDPDGKLLTADRNRAGHAAIRRSGSTTEFELHVQTGGTDHYISPSFTLSGWHYLTLRRDESKIAALDGDRLLASATVPEFSNVKLMRQAPAEAEIAEQATRDLSLAATTAGVWPAFPSDL